MTNETAAIEAPRGLAALLRGWAPFGGLLIAYELMRDLASLIGVQPHNLAPFDRNLFDGYEPTLVLQAAAAQLADRDFLEDAGSLVYGAHFLLPIAVGAWLWAKDRDAFSRFGFTLVILCAMACATNIGPPPDRGRHPEKRAAGEPAVAVFQPRLQPVRGLPLASRGIPRGGGRGRLAAKPGGGDGAICVGGGGMGGRRLPRRALRGRRRGRDRLCRPGDCDRQDDHGTPVSARARPSSSR